MSFATFSCSCLWNFGGDRAQEGRVVLKLSYILHAVLNRGPQTSWSPKAGTLPCQIKGLSLNRVLKLEHFLPLNMHIHGERPSPARLLWVRLSGCCPVKTNLKGSSQAGLARPFVSKPRRRAKKVPQNHLRICGSLPRPPAVHYDGMRCDCSSKWTLIISIIISIGQARKALMRVNIRLEKASCLAGFLSVWVATRGFVEHRK